MSLQELGITERYQKLLLLSQKQQNLLKVAEHVNHQIDLCVKRTNYYRSDAYTRKILLEKEAKLENEREFANWKSIRYWAEEHPVFRDHRL